MRYFHYILAIIYNFFCFCFLNLTCWRTWSVSWSSTISVVCSTSDIMSPFEIVPPFWIMWWLAFFPLVDPTKFRQNGGNSSNIVKIKLTGVWCPFQIIKVTSLSISQKKMGLNPKKVHNFFPLSAHCDIRIEMVVRK